MGGIELGDVIGGDDAEQLAAFKPQADVEAVAAHRDCPVPVDFEFYWHIEAVVFRGVAGIYGGSSVCDVPGVVIARTVSTLGEVAASPGSFFFAGGCASGLCARL